MKPTGLLKINLGILIVVVIALGACLYLLFQNKKDTNTQNNALALLLKKLTGEAANEFTEESKEASIKTPAEPTDKDWEKIFAISEKIYKDQKLTKSEEAFYTKWKEKIDSDIEFCKQFYPVVLKFMDGQELTDEDREFYETNQEEVDKEVNHRKGKLADTGSEKPEDNVSLVPQSSASQHQSSDLNGAKPPLAIEERNRIILSLFEDGIPKTVKKLHDLFKAQTGHDYGKNAYRVFGSMEGKFITAYKKGDKTYYCLPEWFEGRKLKSEFKNRIA